MTEKQAMEVIRACSFQHCRGTLIAFCEGDDYWTDSTKLQRQVDVMRRHPDVSFCVHPYVELRNGTFAPAMTDWSRADKALKASPDAEGFKFSRKDDFLVFQTATVMYRDALFDHDFYNRAKFHCDFVMFHAALRKGIGYFINREMSVYRIGEQGSYMRMARRSRLAFRLRHKWAIYDADPCPETERGFKRTIRAFRNVEFPRSVLLPLRRKLTAAVRRILRRT